MPEFYAHSLEGRQTSEWETMAQHEEATGRLSETKSRASRRSPRREAETAGSRSATECGQRRRKKVAALFAHGGWLPRRAVPANSSSCYEKPQAGIGYTVQIVCHIVARVKRFLPRILPEGGN